MHVTEIIFLLHSNPPYGYTMLLVPGFGNYEQCCFEHSFTSFCVHRSLHVSEECETLNSTRQSNNISHSKSLDSHSYTGAVSFWISLSSGLFLNLQVPANMCPCQFFWLSPGTWVCGWTPFWFGFVLPRLTARLSVFARSFTWTCLPVRCMFKCLPILPPSGCPHLLFYV